MSIVESLASRGIKVWLMGGKIKAFPKQLLTQDIRQIITHNKPALIAELTEIESTLPKPYINEHGEKIIPFDSPKRYHWWAGGQPLEETMRELDGESSTASI